MKTFYFEKLDVWQKARVFVKNIYELTAEFPTEEKYGVISQLRRASLSITANIAEGMSRNTEKDKARFINMAFSSAIEVINFLILTQDLGILSEEKYFKLREQIEEITNKLNSLYSKFDK
jgi:four helix bundle protein